MAFTVNSFISFLKEYSRSLDGSHDYLHKLPFILLENVSENNANLFFNENKSLFEALGYKPTLNEYKEGVSDNELRFVEHLSKDTPAIRILFNASPVPKEETKENATPKRDEYKELSMEEKEFNEILVSEMKVLYEEVIKLVDDTHNSLLLPVKNKCIESLKTNLFKPVLCSLYLNASDDLSSPLYKKLYDTDIKAENYESTLNHYKIRLGCPICGNEWDEELTFKNKGLNTIFCPKCNASRLIDV